MKIYHGSSNKSPLIPAGSYVSRKLSRAANYARHPGNGEGNKIGFIFELNVEQTDVEWDQERDDDACQGKLKIDGKAEKVAVCDIPLPVNRESFIRRYGSNLPWVWSNGKEIEWKQINQ